MKVMFILLAMSLSSFTFAMDKNYQTKQVQNLLLRNDFLYNDSDVLKLNPKKISKADATPEIISEFNRLVHVSKEEKCTKVIPIVFEVKIKNFTVEMIRLKCSHIMYLTVFGSDSKTQLIKGFAESTKNFMLGE